MNKRVLKIKQSATLEMGDLARQMEKQGKSIIKLQTGDPDFSTPDLIVEAAYRAMKDGFTHYTNTRGIPELRASLRDEIKFQYGISYSPDSELLVTCGGIHGIFSTIHALVQPTDEVLIIDPSWMPYDSATSMAGGYPIRIPTSKMNGFQLQSHDLHQAISSKTRVLVINSPCNPSGHILSQLQWDFVLEIVEKNNLILLFDTVYDSIYFENISLPNLDKIADRCIIIGSLSKKYAMTGWRIGYVAAPKKYLDQILKVSQYSITNVPTFIQKAAIEAIENKSLVQVVDKMRATYKIRRDHTANLLQEIKPIKFHLPKGAFYFLLDFSSINQDCLSLSLQLLKEHGVATIPGSAFGECSKGCLRITFATSTETLEEGISRMMQFVDENTET